MAELQRLQKLLAQKGVASRRQIERLIREGRVQLNGKQVVQMGVKIDPEQDWVQVDGRRIPLTAAPEDQSLPLMLNKPCGYLSTCQDPFHRSTVLDLLPATYRGQDQRLYPIGRLDRDSSGLLLLSNDGDLTLHLTHPRYHLPKTYLVEVQGQPSPHVLQQWKEGIDLDDSRTLPAEVTLQDPRSLPDSLLSSDRRNSASALTTWLRVVLHEGKKRQIRRVASRLGHPVLTLHRIAVGSLHLGDLQCGQCRLLLPTEVATLKHESQASYVS
ncbi:MAG: rRNA pseudouridine synthase [Synechococcaceae cyanobacterium SM2_3_1]|nr:rRNA pseudouridine synthase [Synechococcaceae cyanobacterium SM2_3_1]